MTSEQTVNASSLGFWSGSISGTKTTQQIPPCASVQNLFYQKKKNLSGYGGTHSTMKILNKLQVFLLLELVIVLNLLIMDLHKDSSIFYAKICGLI